MSLQQLRLRVLQNLSAQRGVKGAGGADVQAGANECRMRPLGRAGGRFGCAGGSLCFSGRFGLLRRRPPARHCPPPCGLASLCCGQSARGFPSRLAASAVAGAQVGKPSPQGGFGGGGRPSLFWCFFSSIFVLFFARLPCPRGFWVSRLGRWSAPPAPFTIVNIHRFFNNRNYICKC